MRTLPTLVILTSLTLCLATGCSHVQERWKPWQSKTTPDMSVRINVAHIHERQGNLDKAREMYELLLTEHPDHPEVCHRMMVVLARMDEMEQAAEYFDRACQLAPQNALILADWGYARYVAGELDEAERLLREARQRQPQEEQIITNLALVVGAQGKFDESFGLFRSVVGEAEAHANLAFVHTQRGEIALAKKRYSQALDIEPKLKAAQEALLQIAQAEQRLEHKLQDEAPAPTKPRNLETVVESVSPNRPVRAVANAAPESATSLATVQPSRPLSADQVIAETVAETPIAEEPPAEAPTDASFVTAEDLFVQPIPVNQESHGTDVAQETEDTEDTFGTGEAPPVDSPDFQQPNRALDADLSAVGWQSTAEN